MGSLVITIFLLFFSLLLSGGTCLLVGYFSDNPPAKKCGYILLCASPFSPVIVLVVLYAIIGVSILIQHV